jgi:hypothetical protein
MSVDALKRILHDLHSSLSEPTSSYSLAIDLANELSTISAKEAVVSILFDKQYGLLSYLLSARGKNKDHEFAKKSLLLLLETLLLEKKLDLTSHLSVFEFRSSILISFRTSKTAAFQFIAPMVR